MYFCFGVCACLCNVVSVFAVLMCNKNEAGSESSLKGRCCVACSVLLGAAVVVIS